MGVRIVLMKNKALRGTAPFVGEEPKSRWCSGLAYEPVTLMTRVRIPTGTPDSAFSSPLENLREIILPSSCMFRISGPVAQHGRAFGFYFSEPKVPGKRNQVVVGPNPTGPARTRLSFANNCEFEDLPSVGRLSSSGKSLSLRGEIRARAGKQVALHFQRKNNFVSEELI